MKYTATCVRSGGWWAITVPEISGLFSQARRLDQVEGMAREAITLLLDVDPQAEESAEEATITAVRALLAKGYTVRDAGALLGISAQRVSQLAPKRAASIPDKGGEQAYPPSQDAAAA
ncbi:hypothetical protein [Micromonospora sp. NPDC049240]|uniref:hypothetical protein n=1 Tax=Micromonospora sp. NPDC049240 TaxID=3155151 RepID=UPI0033F3D9EA